MVETNRQWGPWTRLDVHGVLDICQTGLRIQSDILGWPGQAGALTCGCWRTMCAATADCNLGAALQQGLAAAMEQQQILQSVLARSQHELTGLALRQQKEMLRTAQQLVEHWQGRSDAFVDVLQTTLTAWGVSVPVEVRPFAAAVPQRRLILCHVAEPAARTPVEPLEADAPIARIA